MRSRTRKPLALGLVTAALAAGPAQAVPDEGGGAAQPTPHVRVEGFNWSDAGIGAAAGLAAIGTALAVRRHRIALHEAARPAAR